MNRSTWKGFERRVARYFGAERNPLSGGNSRHTRSDSLHPMLYIECKCGKTVPKTWAAISKLFADTETKAEKENKVPIVVIKPAGTSSKVADYTCYFRLKDGVFHETLVAMPLWAVKEWLVEYGPNGHPSSATLTPEEGTFAPPPTGTIFDVNATLEQSRARELTMNLWRQRERSYW